MPPFDTMPVWVLALAIFLLRIVDVSLGTLRTITVVHGRVPVSVAIGFFEVLVWLIAVSQVIAQLDRSPFLAIAYAAGFACGNAVGIALERRLALGTVVVRMITGAQGERVAASLRQLGYDVTTFGGRGGEGERTLLFTSCRRRDLSRVVGAAGELDERLFFTVDRFSQATYLGPLPHPTGWRAVPKKK
jgi:uncharacterized protein YebE (UPF0316 family)